MESKVDGAALFVATSKISRLACAKTGIHRLPLWNYLCAVFCMLIIFAGLLFCKRLHGSLLHSLLLSLYFLDIYIGSPGMSKQSSRLSWLKPLK